MANEVYSFIGLATKAGRLVSGDETCERALKSKQVYLVLVAQDASSNTRKKFTDMCLYRGIDMRVFGEKTYLGRYTGKEMRSVVAILEEGFAKRLIEMIDKTDTENGGV